MRRLCCSSFIFILLLLAPLHAALQDKSAMLYYGEDISWSMVGVHDYIIVQPEHTNTDTHGFKIYSDQVYGYVSLGEIEENQDYYGAIDQSWVLGTNEIWNSEVVDYTQKGYRDFMIKEVLLPLHKRGFKNFFFDTLDSYMIYAKDQKSREAQEQALILFLQEIKEALPQSKIVINRGFEVLKEVVPLIDGVLFESYYDGLDGKLKYCKKSQQDREWLDGQLQVAKDAKLDIIAVDYFKDPHSKVAQQSVKALQDKGFIPFVSDHTLHRYGHSSKMALKREVLMVYDGALMVADGYEIHDNGAVVIEHMGYVPTYWDVSKKELPQHVSEQYAAVIIWMDLHHKNPKKLFDWVLKNSKEGVKTLFFNDFGVELKEGALDALDIEIEAHPASIVAEREITYRDPMFEYEMPIKIQPHDALIMPSNAKKYLSYSVDGEASTLAAKTAWGGYVLDEVSISSFGDDTLWMFDPFKLFQEVLELPHIPKVDPTTENGLRLSFTHIDGDAILNRAEFDPDLYSGDVVYEKILRRYKIPHTVSIVEAEIAPYGKYPKLSKRLESLAKKIYRLENVEGATHTFTHPFFWQKIEDDNLSPLYRLNVPNYTREDFSVERELSGSLNYINTKLFPKGKKKTRMILWSGNCIPQEDVMAYVYHHDLLNMNGGDTTIRNEKPWLYNVAPLIARVGPYYRIQTGSQNENVYTNDWKGPFWGFKKVIQTFKLTESPRRLKPIDIYYHFYSASKSASLSALKQVFEWSMKQETMPIYTSEYIQKAMETYDVSIAQEDQAYLFKGMHYLKNIRLDEHFGAVDFKASQGVVGENSIDQGRYISFADQKERRLVLTPKPIAQPHLVTANAALVGYEGENYHFKGYVPLKLEFNIPTSCRLSVKPKAFKITKKGENVTLLFKQSKEAVVNVNCQR